MSDETVPAPKLVNEPDILCDGFARLDEHVLDARAPRIRFYQKFHERSEERKIEYLTKLASTMNHAAKLLQDERDALVKLVDAKEKKIVELNRMLVENSTLIQHEVTRMNDQKQGYHEEVSRLNQRIRDLEQAS